MGEIQRPAPVLPVTVIFSRYPEALAWAKGRIQQAWGEIVLESELFPFEQTPYYDAEMGQHLRKCFVVTLPQMDAAELVGRKHQSNAWEAEFAAQANVPEPRPLNIDPGYMTLSKLVLASSKDFAHLLYMADGIFAEITLFYRRGGWQAHEWTFPDFRAETYHAFLTQCRELLKRDR